jgi:hypothetical protein
LSIPDEEKGTYRIVDRVGNIFPMQFEFDNEVALRGKEFMIDTDNVLHI